MAIARLSSSTLKGGLLKTTNLWDELSKDSNPFGTGNVRGYLPFNDSTTDLSGNISFSTATDITYTAGINGQGRAAVFNGSTSQLRMLNYPVVTGNAARSISLWSYIPSITAAPSRMLLVGNGLFGGTNGSNFDFEAHVYKSTVAGQISWNYGIHYWGDGIPFLESPVLYNQWVHLVVVHDGGNLSSSNTRLYVNGMAPKTLESVNVAFNVPSNAELQIGRRFRNDIQAPDLPLNGRMEQLRLFNTALNAQQVAYLFNNGVGL